jgi:hypothetical protein
MTEVVLSFFRKMVHRIAVGHRPILPFIFRRYDHPAVGCQVTSCVCPFLTFCFGSQDD